MRPYFYIYLFIYHYIIMCGADELLKSAIPLAYLLLSNCFSSCLSYSILGPPPHFLDLLDYLLRDDGPPIATKLNFFCSLQNELVSVFWVENRNSGQYPSNDIITALLWKEVSIYATT
jgi:hypothetical protein